MGHHPTSCICQAVPESYEATGIVTEKDNLSFSRPRETLHRSAAVFGFCGHSSLLGFFFFFGFRRLPLVVFYF